MSNIQSREELNVGEGKEVYEGNRDIDGGLKWARGGGGGRAAQGKSKFGWGILLARTVGEGV